LEERTIIIDDLIYLLLRPPQDCVHDFETKIKDDSFRTFRGNQDFWQRVKESDLIRVLNAVAVDFGYVQGMNVLLGPFLYIMPEVDSYYCLSTLISKHCPKYVSKNLDGVYKGCELLDKCLESLDKELYEHIKSKMTLDVFSVPYIMTLFANMQPLNEVLKLWDAIFAFGIHFVVPLLVTYLMLMRDALLAQHSAYK
jgi:cell cycle arrest protein BUB2